MGSKQVELHEEAITEAQAAFEWYAVRNPVAAEGFIGELDQAIEQIAAFPDAGSGFLSGTRRHVMRRFPFTVIYREQEQNIQVIAVAHGRRKPGYWKKRLKHGEVPDPTSQQNAATDDRRASVVPFCGLAHAPLAVER